MRRIGIFIIKKQHHYLKLLLYILKYKPEKIIIYLDIVPNIFVAEWLYLISHFYRGMWMYKPRISDKLSLRYYLIGNKCRIHKFDKSITKSLFTSIKNIAELIKKEKFINSILDNVTLPAEFKQQLTHFNGYMYRIYMEKYQEIQKISAMYPKDNQEITEYKKQQKEISEIWIKKYKIV